MNVNDTTKEISDSQSFINSEKSDHFNLVLEGRDEDDKYSEVNELGKQIKNMDLYERMNFKRIMVKRNSKKGKTGISKSSAPIFEKFTTDIVKYTEVCKEAIAYNKSTKKIGERTKKVQFATTKTTYQYPKEKETGLFHTKQFEELEEAEESKQNKMFEFHEDDMYEKGEDEENQDSDR